MGSTVGQASTPLSRRHAHLCPLWENQGHPGSCPVLPDGHCRPPPPASPLGGLQGAVHRGCRFTVKRAGAVGLGRQILNINPFDI